MYILIIQPFILNFKITYYFFFLLGGWVGGGEGGSRLTARNSCNLSDTSPGPWIVNRAPAIWLTALARQWQLLRFPVMHAYINLYRYIYSVYMYGWISWGMKNWRFSWIQFVINNQKNVSSLTNEKVKRNDRSEIYRTTYRIDVNIQSLSCKWF